MDNPTEIIPLDDLRSGDTVIIDGVWKTTDRHAIKRCPLIGTSLWGDARGLHGRTIEVVLFPVWAESGLQGYARQN